ncbi:MAG: phosphatase PAP2 family protein [Deltaproteobacteria bacterium]|nr:phosphatase PAP2 family protein [Deltaproteobacteria bacterium]
MLRAPGPAPLSPTDWLELAFLIWAGSVAVVVRPEVMWNIGAAAVVVVVFARLAPGHPWAARIHDLSPIVAIILFFELCGPLVDSSAPSLIDGSLRATDVRYFSVVGEAWRDALHRPAWLTDLASVSYVSFYFIPTAIALTLHAQGRAHEFRRFAFTLTATFFASYVLYFVTPALGPRLPPAVEDHVLGGGVVSAWVRHFVHALEGAPLDAFPSGHTAGSLVFAVLGSRAFPRWAPALVASAALIIFSTVYLSYHYVTDVAGGAALAAAMLGLQPWLDALADPTAEQR